MFQDKYVFAQLVSFLNRSKFNCIVARYNGDRYVKHFSCWNQLLALMFGQLSNRDSLRDLIVALDAHHSKCYHLGMGRNVSKSSLARANQDRDYHIFEEYAYYLVNEAREKRATNIFHLGGNIYAFDSTTIDLCLSVFWGAKFRKKKGGIKVHTLYDVETQIPAFFHITEASVHHEQSNALRLILQSDDVRIKVELSHVIRGTVFPEVRMEVCETVEREFGYAEIQVASWSDLYAGKIAAALDRQHPRD